MKIFYFILLAFALCFCIVGAYGHVSGFSAAALCFFAATMLMIRQKDKK